MRTKPILVRAEQNTWDEANEQSAAFTRTPAGRKAGDPLGCRQLLVSFLGSEFRPEQLEHNAIPFFIHQSENM
jgi:hypothetical protein